MKTYLLLLIYVLATLNDNGQILSWAKQYVGDAISFNTGYSLSSDNSANVYTTGCFYGKVDFDPRLGIGDTGYLKHQGDHSDIFITKMDREGNLVWAKQIDAAPSKGRWCIDIDAYCNIYLTGYYYGI